MSLYAVSIDPPAESKVFAERIAADGRGAVRFPLLSDAGHRVIDAYRLRDTAYDGKEYEGIPHPAVYVIDKSGQVTWMKVEENYRVRPTNADIRAALDAAN